MYSCLYQLTELFLKIMVHMEIKVYKDNDNGKINSDDL